MNDTDQNNELIEYFCRSLFNVQGRLRANEITLNSLMSVVCENAPELIEQIKFKINDVADLSLKMGELSTDFSIDDFNKEIDRSIRQFSLIEESAKYCPTQLEVKKK